MAHFPMFIPLEGREVIVVGSGHHAEDKIGKLKPFGAKIRRVEVLTREELTSAPAMVILSGPDRSGAALCKEANIPVNSVDDPDNCSFYFPSLIRRGDLTVGISSGGAAPAASVVVRRRIDEMLPENMEEILPWLAVLTARLRREISDYDRRAALLREATQLSFEKNRPLTGDEVEEFMKNM